MKIIKKSFNVDADLAQHIDDIIQQNPGASFTLVMNMALRQWLKKPTFELNRSAATEEDIQEFLRENSGLMDDLLKCRPSSLKGRKKRIADGHEKVMREHDATFRKLAK